MIGLDISTSAVVKDRPLVAEKISLPDETPHLSRPRLVARLSESLKSCTATIISGRARTGKTVLAADFARHCGRRVAWYKVDAADSELPVFFRYLLEAIRQQRQGFDHEALQQHAESITPNRIYQLAESFVVQLTISEGDPQLIVIEDLHLVYDTNWIVPFLWRLLPLLPADVHLLITCRSLPPNPLWRMRSKQTLLVIDESELAFTLDETLCWFRSRGWDERLARKAWEETNGRAGALANFRNRIDSARTKDFPLPIGAIS